MHYLALLLTETLPTKQQIERALDPYDWDKNFDEEGELIGEHPIFTFDYFQIGGRYCGYLKLKMDKSNQEYNWNFYERNPRNNRLFISSLLNQLKENIDPPFMYSEEKYFPCMGSRDGFLYVDGAKAKDIINYDELESYICILPDGSAIAKETWDGKHFVEDKDYHKKLKKALKDNSEGFVTVLDLHD